MPAFHFIAGMNRSGSTMLAAILRQNPMFHAAITTPVHNLFRTLHRHMGKESPFHIAISEQKRAQMLRGLFFNWYADVDKPVIFDLHKWWSQRIDAIHLLFPTAKILCPMRDPAWVIDSYERIFRQYPLHASALYGYDTTWNVYTRVETLSGPTGGLGLQYNSMREAYFGPYRNKLIIIDYDDICATPNDVMASVYEQLGLPFFQHDFDHLEIPEEQRLAFDLDFGLPMHKIRAKVESVPRQTVLPPDIFAAYHGRCFWKEAENVLPLRHTGG